MSFLQSFLEKNNIAFQTSPEGIHYQIDEPGEGEAPKAGDYVKVHYTGKFLDGKVFDSSKGRDPFSLQLGQGSVIKGWDLGLMLFPKGSKGKLYLEPEFAYGERGAGGVIPPNASLVFEIEMLEIMDEAAFLEDQRAAWVAYVEERMAVELPGILAFAEAEGLDLARTDSGLHYVIEKIGSGKQAEANKEVSVHYTGRLLNGGKFDSSHDRNRPISFPLGTGKVIQGWDEGIALFKEGGKGKLIIPSYLGYGGRDMGSIPANSTLVFDIELLEVK